MLTRLKRWFKRPSVKPIRQLPLWMVLLVLAPPFFAITADWFERMERTGTVGAIIADTMFPAILVTYLIFVYVLKQRGKKGLPA